MAKLKLKDLAAIMKHIDIAMMTTYGPRGILETRPMSNNRDVEYDGNSYFFTMKKQAVAKELAKDNNVNLAFVGHHSIINRKSVYISVIGKAKLIDDKATMKKHWNKDLEIWFKKGLDTPGIVMIAVKAKSIRYWDGWDEGVVTV